MTHSLFRNKQVFQRKRGAVSELSEATISDFSGGLNVVDNETKLKSYFAVELTNIYKQSDGTLEKRFGTQFLLDVTGTVAGDIIEIVDFQDTLIVFMDSGEVAKVTYAGVATAIWNTAIAAALPGAPSGWSGSNVTIDTTEFRNELIVCNGLDKPILIDDTLTVIYLQDIPTGSNIFIPVGTFVTTNANYTIIAGIPAVPDEIYISAQGTSGTWPGAPAPNDAISINIASYAPSTGGTIRGIGTYKDFLFIYFATATVVMKLGAYDATGNHTPTYMETIAKTGLVSHRTYIDLVNEHIFAGPQGVNTTKRNVFATAIDTKVITQKIHDLFVTSTPTITTNRHKSFSVYDSNEKNIIFFLYQGSSYDIYIMSFDETVKKVAWAVLDTWDWSAGCGANNKRVYFTKGSKIFQYGNGIYTDEDFAADEIGNFDSVWAATTAYVVGDRVQEGSDLWECTVAHTSSGTFTVDEELYWEEYTGLTIPFVWELPWSDINTRMRKKHLGYLGLDTNGQSTFTVSIFVDNIYLDASSVLDPSLEMEFVAGDSPGYGAGSQPYGGGRRAADERRWGYPIEFNKMKLRVTGTSKESLSFSAMTILYKKSRTFHR